MSCRSLLCLWKEGIGILIKPLDSPSLVSAYSPRCYSPELL
ncbi:Succinate dehydrogenase cytochrome B subunit, partial [Fusarium oxysporum f. sp. albedinis]